MNESLQTEQPVTYDDEIDLRELFRMLWAGKWLIGSITIAATMVAVIIALLLPNMYRAEALLAPNDQEGAGRMSALANQYGGLATLAGINIGGGSSDKTTLGLEVLKSRKFISDFVERHDILVPLMAAKGWNPEKGELIIDPRHYDVVSGKWVRDANLRQNTIPSMQEAYEEFKSILSVSEDKNTGFVSVAINHYSPKVAKQWVDWLIEDLNSSIMRQDVAQAKQAIEYLNKQIEITSLAELQNVFFRLIEEETKTVMLANVTDEYVFKILDPAIAPENKYRPKRAMIALMGLVLGGVLGVAAALVRSALTPDPRPPRTRSVD